MSPAVLTRSADETERVGQAVGRQLRPGDLVMLSGDLGTGKTTFVKGIARGLDVTDPVTSPTFTIVQEYDGRCSLAHVDAYRLERVQELHDLGFDEMLDDRIVVVEWGEAVAPALPAERLEVRISGPDGPDPEERHIEIEPCGPAWRARRAELDGALGVLGSR